MFPETLVNRVSYFITRKACKSLCQKTNASPQTWQIVTVRHDNMHRYEWLLGRVVRVFPDPLGVIRTAEVEEGGRSSIRSVTFLVPLELNCYDDEEGDISETEGAGDYNEATISKADKPQLNEESITSGHNSPIALDVDSTSTGPPKSPQAETAEMQLSRLYENPMCESADQVERDSESPPQRMSVGATPQHFHREESSSLSAADHHQS